ncbi:hypothetical protein HMN09_00828300 [Mycena chlorophos]|uniref:Uncharacterized protein n=1 Tax=Mycena chlorophos TaxID=658473 RepID=A0A8H6SUQ5_MYCCL|nr:hypothetical protein HMN09_00828300 [Mycena chlorophos]
MLPVAYGLLILLVQLFLAPATSAIGVLLPLYVYPGNGCSAWSSVNSAISSASSTQWYIIINPNSGPGSTDTLYQGCVASLASATNRITMGYVLTTQNNVENDIDTYASWPSDARPNGIYLDTITATDANLEMYTGYVNYAKSKGFTFLAIDPGVPVSDSYISIADLVNSYEGAYSAFEASSMTGTLSKQSVNLESAPSTGTYTTIIDQLESLGVAAVYITDQPDTSQTLPAQLSEFVSEVSGAGGSSSPSSGNSGSSGGSTSSPEGSAASSSGLLGTATLPSSAAPSGAKGTAATKGSATVAAADSTSSASGLSSHSSNPNSGSSSSSSNTSSSTTSSSSSHGPSVAAIVGGVLGALVVILILLVVGLCVKRRRQSHGNRLESGAFAPFTEMRQNRSVETAGLPSSTSHVTALEVETSSVTCAPSQTMLSSPDRSSLDRGTSVAPSRQWQTWAADIKHPISDSDEPAASSSSTSPTTSPSAAGRSIPLPNPQTLSTELLAEQPESRSRTLPRHSLMSAFSSYTGSTVPAYPGGPPEPLPSTPDPMLSPPPAYGL